MKYQYHLLVANHKKEDAYYTAPNGFRVPMYKEWEEWIVMDDSKFDEYCDNHPNLDYIVKVINKRKVKK